MMRIPFLLSSGTADARTAFRAHCNAASKRQRPDGWRHETVISTAPRFTIRIPVNFWRSRL